MELEEESADNELTPTDRRNKVVDILIAGILRMRSDSPAICMNLVTESNLGLELVSKSLLSVSDDVVTRGDTHSQLSQTRQTPKRNQR